MARAKVLLIDDEVEFASTLAERLNIRGYDASAIYSTVKVLDKVRSDMPDVVILDLKMPGTSGLEILKAIKEFDSSIEVILLTGHGSEQCTTDCVSRGAFDYMIKPIEIDNLTAKIDMAVGKKQK
ncbi:MAG: response regulator [Dissulfurispiraceae bacterium]|jgi:DNA-binding NtrC family response regulator